MKTSNEKKKKHIQLDSIESHHNSLLLFLFSKKLKCFMLFYALQVKHTWNNKMNCHAGAVMLWCESHKFLHKRLARDFTIYCSYPTTGPLSQFSIQSFNSFMILHKRSNMKVWRKVSWNQLRYKKCFLTFFSLLLKRQNDSGESRKVTGILFRARDISWVEQCIKYFSVLWAFVG